VCTSIISGALYTSTLSNTYPDGLPYEILRLILDHPASDDLVSSIYNDALLKKILP
ncbi:hypothetical protein CLU79DRAFT_711756, partial [Phycomyces nitens]